MSHWPQLLISTLVKCQIQHKTKFVLKTETNKSAVQQLNRWVNSLIFIKQNFIFTIHKVINPDYNKYFNSSRIKLIFHTVFGHYFQFFFIWRIKYSNFLPFFLSIIILHKSSKTNALAANFIISLNSISCYKTYSRYFKTFGIFPKRKFCIVKNVHCSFSNIFFTNYSLCLIQKYTCLGGYCNFFRIFNHKVST